MTTRRDTLATALSALTLPRTAAPGGTSDVVTRMLGQKLGELWRTIVVVNNRPGGGTVIGSSLVQKAPRTDKRLPESYAVIN